MEFHFKPQGVCSKGIDIELDGDIIKSVKFTGGCNGNTQGVAALAAGIIVLGISCRISIGIMNKKEF